MSADSITIIRARARRLAKVIRTDGTIEDYDLARTVDLIAAPVADLGSVGALLTRLLPRPDCAVVRGNIVDPGRVRGVRRLVHPDRQEGDSPTLQEAAHHWLAVDAEGVDRPDGLRADDLPGCAAEAIRRLPAAFHDVRCIAQASAGHGIKPGVRMRLWYWLSRPATGPELQRWLRGSCADPSVFRPAQLIYTAAPVFEGGVDHLPSRIADIPGRPLVPIPSPAALAPPPPRPVVPVMRPTEAGAQKYGYAALTAASARVAHAPVNSRHATLVTQARGLARLVAAGLLSRTEVDRCLGDAITQAGKTRDEASAVLAWAMENPAAGHVPSGGGG